MYPRPALLAVLGAVVTAVCGCGGGSGGGSQGGNNTFDGDGYSFTYPGDWAEQSGDTSFGRIDALVAPPEGGRNLVGLTVVRNAVPEPVTKTNIGEAVRTLRPAVDGYVAGSRSVLESGPTPVTSAGLPGFRFEVSSTGLDPPVHARVSWLFVGTTAYAFRCQFESSGAEEVAHACQQVLESFQADPNAHGPPPPIAPASGTVTSSSPEPVYSQRCKLGGVRYVGKTAQGARVCLTLTPDGGTLIEAGYTFVAASGCPNGTADGSSWFQVVDQPADLDASGHVEVDTFSATIRGAKASGVFSDSEVCPGKKFAWSARRQP